MRNLAIKTITAFVLALLVASCATRGSNTIAMKDAQKFEAQFKEWQVNYGACVSPIVSQNPEVFDKVLRGANDERKVQLLTLNQPISKQFKINARIVVEQFGACEKQAYINAKSFSPDFASAFYTGAQNGDIVFIDMINGAFKTYGDFNKKWLQVLIENEKRTNEVMQRIAQNFQSRHQAEIADENNRMAAAMMIMGAGMQNTANTYHNNANAYRNSAPVNTNCRQIGGTFSCTSY